MNRLSPQLRVTRTLVIGGSLALMYCVVVSCNSDSLATVSQNPTAVIQDEEAKPTEAKPTEAKPTEAKPTEAKTTEDTRTEEKQAAPTSSDVQPDMQSAAERRREQLMKGRVNEKEDRPEKPTFTNRPKSTGGISNITFDDIKFEMEKGTVFRREMLTAEINLLDGARVSLRGYIRPSTRQKNLTKFVFVRDNKECCFGPGAALYDCVLVKLVKGEKSDYTVRPVTIEGDFFFKEYTGPDGRIWAIYRMQNSVIK